MQLLLLCFFIYVFASCNNPSEYGERLSESDSLVIQFTDTVYGQVLKSMQATAPEAIEKLSRFVDGKPVEVFKCGYDGNMIFYKNGIVNGEVSFQYSKKDCRHFLYSEEGRLTSTGMSNEAADFLKGMAEGRSWY